MRLYHGSAKKIEGPLVPVLRHGSEDHVHERGAVFATDRRDIASLFMIPSDTLSSIGFENDIAYICIWGTSEDFATRDPGGYVYVLPSEGFEKIGKSYEWQCLTSVLPIEVCQYDSVIDGMIECGGKVYFINDNAVFDNIVANKYHRTPILQNLRSENERR